MLAQARTMEVINGVRGGEVFSDWMFEVHDAAISLGHDEASQGLSDPPVMFQNEPHLLRWWERGQDLYWGLREMAECPGCNDGTGNPCPSHG